MKYHFSSFFAHSLRWKFGALLLMTGLLLSALSFFAPTLSTHAAPATSASCKYQQAATGSVFPSTSKVQVEEIKWKCTSDGGIHCEATYQGPGSKFVWLRLVVWGKPQLPVLEPTVTATMTSSHNTLNTPTVHRGYSDYACFVMVGKKGPSSENPVIDGTPLLID